MKLNLNNNLVFCSDCKHFIKIGECSKGHDIDEITPSICEDGVESNLFEELDNMDDFDWLEELVNVEHDQPKLTPEEEKLIELHEQRQYEQVQKEMDDEFEDNLNVEKFELREREEFDPTNPKYYL